MKGLFQSCYGLGLRAVHAGPPHRGRYLHVQPGHVFWWRVRDLAAEHGALPGESVLGQDEQALSPLLQFIYPLDLLDRLGRANAQFLEGGPVTEHAGTHLRANPGQLAESGLRTAKTALFDIAGLGWPSGRPFARLIKRSCGWHRRRRERLLAELRAGGGAAARLVWYPTGDAGIRPTRAGNAFAALGQRIRRRHGLDLSACWPLIEQTLSQPARERLEQASSRVAGRVQNLLWTIAAVLWLPAFPVGLAVVIAVIGAVLAALLWWAVGAAVEQYCALIEASVATNRRAMYVAIGWPPPTSTKQEPDHGRALTGYLTRLSGWGDVDLEWPNDAGA